MNWHSESNRPDRGGKGRRNVDHHDERRAGLRHRGSPWKVFGLTVRSRNVGSQFGAWLKSLRGGELKGMTKMLAEGRQHATDRLIEEAESKGANVIVAFRFDTSELGGTWTEICAYGTVVRARRVTSS
jgi:uncharacterized protein YbjQ (UPF0145 family)